MTSTVSYSYLEYLSNIRAPREKVDFYDPKERQEQCRDYCDLRNAAKNLLDDLSDEEAREKLSILIKKLRIEYGDTS